MGRGPQPHVRPQRGRREGSARPDQVVGHGHRVDHGACRDVVAVVTAQQGWFGRDRPHQETSTGGATLDADQRQRHVVDARRDRGHSIAEVGRHQTQVERLVGQRVPGQPIQLLRTADEGTQPGPRQLVPRLHRHVDHGGRWRRSRFAPPQLEGGALVATSPDGSANGVHDLVVHQDDHGQLSEIAPIPSIEPVVVAVVEPVISHQVLVPALVAASSAERQHRRLVTPRFAPIDMAHLTPLLPGRPAPGPPLWGKP